MADHDLTLPWRTDDPYPDVILDSDGEEVASCSDDDDCEFIVKAVNNHDLFMKIFEKIADVSQKDSLTDSERLADIRSVVNAILGRVGGARE